MAFEETEEELRKNVASLGYDLKDLTDNKKLIIDYVHIERSEMCLKFYVPGWNEWLEILRSAQDDNCVTNRWSFGSRVSSSLN